MKRIPYWSWMTAAGLAESGVIVEYLEDKFPTPSFRPQSPEACARMRFLIQVADIYLMQALLPLFHLFDAKERDMAAIEQQLGKLDIGFMQVNDLRTDNTYADGNRLSLADIWLMPVRFTIDGLMGFSGRKTLLDRYKRLAGYRDVINGDPTLKRVWQEMEEGLKAFTASRAEAAKAS
ncbi:MAG: glutathione S-transferase family protein [Rhodospirillaceae bacterium]|nr:MAG: glutathione S-transferase family protein [Rhodospirillaceae bacterium]